jgi:chromosomal replication initiation ATPase DnaA
MTVDYSKTPAQAADDAAEAIRTLNHVSFDGDAFAHPGDIYNTVMALLSMVQRLPQAIEQAEHRLYSMLDAGAVYDDRDPTRENRIDAAVSVEETASSLTEARVFAKSLAGALEGAVIELSHLGGK